MTQAAITFVTGGSGGIGKSTAARMLAHALGSARLRTALVDGNPGQQSQRAWLNIPDSKALEYALVDGLQSALVRPRDTGGMFALLAGPADPHSRDMARDYLESIIGLRAMCDMVVVDADRVDGRLWDDPASFAGGVMRPMVEAGGARILFRIGQSGSQTDDGLAALDAIRRPDRIRAVAVAPPGVKPWPARRWHALLDGLAEYGGVDVWDEASRRLIDSHACGWAHGMEPDWLRGACVWMGADPDAWRSAEGRGRSWLLWSRTR